MRIRVLDLDVTPEELARAPEVRQLLAAHLPGPAAGNGADAPGGGDAASLPPAVANVLELKGPGGAVLHTLESFLASLLRWPGVDARVGISRLNRDDPANIVRLHRRGSAGGAFVYVELPAAGLKFRLPRTHSLEGLVHARARDVKPGAPYGITLRLRPATLAEALTLARQAYEHAEDGAPAKDRGKQTPRPTRRAAESKSASTDEQTAPV